MAYTSASAVRLLTNLTTDDISDTDVNNIIAEATKEVNSMMNVLVIREKIDYIDNTRKNTIDGSNKTYYIKNWKDKYIADMDNDGSVDASDIIVYAVESGTGNETIATVSSVDSASGKFVLENAYSSNYTLYVTYSWCYLNPSTPAPLITLATTLLSAAYCYAKINIGRAPQVAFGNTKIYRHMESFDHYYDRFLKIMEKINERMPDTQENEI